MSGAEVAAPTVAARRRRPGTGGLVAATGWSSVGVALAGGTRFGYSVLLGHLGGAAVLGAVNSALSLAVFAGLVGPTAAGSAASKFVARALGARSPEGARRTWEALLRVAAPLAAVVAVAAGAADVVVLHRSTGHAASASALVLAMSAYLLVRGARFGTGDFARAAAGEAVAAGVALVLLVVVLLAGSPSLALLPLAAGYAAFAVIAWPRRTTWRAPAGSGPTGAPDAAGARASAVTRELPAFLAWSVLGSVASAGLMQLSVVVAAASDTPVRVGRYAAAVAVGTPMALLAVPLFQALFSLLARSAGGQDAAGVRQRTDAATRALVVVVVAAGGGVALVARTALAVVGPHLGAAVPLLHVVALAVLVGTVTVPAVASLTSGSQAGVRLVSLMSGCGLVVGLAVMAVCVPTAGASVLPWGLGMGVDGVAAGYAAGTAVTNALPWCVAWRRHHLAWRGLTARVVGALAVLVVLVRLPWAATYLGGWVLGLAFAAAWLAVSSRDVLRLLRLRTRPA